MLPWRRDHAHARSMFVCVGANSQVSRLPVWLLHARDGDVHLHSAEEQAQTQHGGHHAGVGGSVFSFSQVPDTSEINK